MSYLSAVPNPARSAERIFFEITRAGLAGREYTACPFPFDIDRTGVAISVALVTASAAMMTIDSKFNDVLDSVLWRHRLVNVCGAGNEA